MSGARIYELHPGQRFTRPRGFGLGPRASKWWLAPLSHDGFVRPDIAVTGEGIETIEIVEIVPTRTFGALAYYRRWVTDPDGKEVKLEWVPRSNEVSDKRESVLRVSLARMGFAPAEVRAVTRARAERPALRLVCVDGDAA
jgi:hypothetical protein